MKRIKKKDPTAPDQTPPDQTPQDTTKPPVKKPPAKKKAECEGCMRTDAGVRPMDVGDGGASLEDQLKSGFLAAYNERTGA